jgi:hypothetical protein
MEKSSLKKINKVESKEKYHIMVSNRFTALEYLETIIGIPKFQSSRVKVIVSCGSISHGSTKDA